MARRAPSFSVMKRAIEATEQRDHFGGGGRQQQDAPAAKGEEDEEAQADEDAEQSHGSDAFEQLVEVDRGPGTKIVAIGLQETLRGATALMVQQREEFPLRVEF